MIKLVRILTFLLAVVITIFSIFYVDAEKQLVEAKAAYRSGDMDQALRKARRANRAFSDDAKKADAYYIQARAASKMNWKEKAKDYLDELLALDNEHIYGLLFSGEIALQLGQNENALRNLDNGLTLASGKIKPNTLAYYLSKRGLARLALGQTNEAEVDARQALLLSANLPEAHDLISKVLEEKGDIKGALEECERAYQLTIDKNKMLIFEPEGRELSDRLVDLKVKCLQTQ